MARLVATHGCNCGGATETLLKEFKKENFKNPLFMRQLWLVDVTKIKTQLVVDQQ